MFTRRNLIALSTLWHYISEINDTNVKEKLKFVFTRIVFLLICNIDGEKEVVEVVVVHPKFNQ